jgi:large subunit ribosomal protein L29
MKNSYKELSLEELTVKREELRKQLNDVRFNAIVGHLDDPLSERTVRRRLARVSTMLHEIDLGLRKVSKKT